MKKNKVMFLACLFSMSVAQATIVPQAIASDEQAENLFTSFIASSYTDLIQSSAIITQKLCQAHKRKI